MPYVAAAIKPEKDEACFLCEHPKDDAKHRENFVLLVREHAFVCLNRYPFTPGHMLVSPTRHVGDLAELSDVEYAALTNLIRESSIRLKQAVKCHGMNVGMNLGKDAGAGLADHLHCHIVPRWRADLNFMPVIADVKVMPMYLDEVWANLNEAFADLRG